MAKNGTNTLTGLIPILYEALQVVSRELVGFIPATSRNMTKEGAALNQSIRVPITPPSENQDITPGKPPENGGEEFDYVDMMITKNRIARPIVWNGDEEISVGGQLSQLLINQYTQAMRSLVNEVERDVCAEGVLGALEAGNVYGSAGLTPFASGLDDLAAIKKVQDDLGTPLGDRHLLINTATGMALRKLTQLTNVNQAGENDMLRRGVLNDLMGYMLRESGGFMPSDPGTATGFTLSANAAAGATAIAVGALTGTILRGAVIVLGGKYYTVAADALVTATTLQLSHPLPEALPSGTDGTIMSSYMPNVAFSRDFIYLATRAPAMPRQGDEARDVTTITDPVSGLSFQVALYGVYRQVRGEIGLAWGVKAINKRHGVLLLG